MGHSELPPGWSLARVRERAAGAELLDPEGVLVVADVPGRDDYLELEPACILDFGGLCLVLARPPEEGWWMGQLDDDGQSIICWGIYGEANELGDVIAAL